MISDQSTESPLSTLCREATSQCPWEGDAYNCLQHRHAMWFVIQHYALVDRHGLQCKERVDSIIRRMRRNHVIVGVVWGNTASQYHSIPTAGCTMPCRSDGWGGGAIRLLLTITLSEWRLHLSTNSKHSGNRRRVLGMNIAMDRANLVCKDVKANSRDGKHYIMKRWALRQHGTLLEQTQQQAVAKQAKSRRMGGAQMGTSTN